MPLPAGWSLFDPATQNAAPRGTVIFNGLAIPVGQFNTISAAGGFRNAGGGGNADPDQMPTHVIQRLRGAEIGNFSGNAEENATQWIRSASNKLLQVDCPQRFWRSEVAIRLTQDAATWSQAWHEATPAAEQTWDAYQRDFTGHFAPADTEVRIARACKMLRQEGSIQEYIREWETLRMQAPVGMDFDTVSVRLDFFNGLKPHIIRQTDFSRANTLRGLYMEVRGAEIKSDTLFEAIRVQQNKDPKKNGRPGPSKEGTPKNNKPYARNDSRSVQSKNNKWIKPETPKPTQDVHLNLQSSHEEDDSGKGKGDL